MARTVRDALLTALDNLSGRSFKRFRSKITDWDIKEGFNTIAKSLLEKAEPDDVVDLILNHYKECYGPELTVEVLEAIDEKQEASKLMKDLENGQQDKLCTAAERMQQAVTCGTWFQSPPQSASSHKMHFVDQHREALIKGVALVDPILDSLMSANLLTYEDYSTIRREGTSYAQMRMLFYKYVCSWEEPQKDVLNNALKKNNRILMENLGGS
ncbi:PREDICTED: apoptosis-associated speck-like protein containing a CARD [Nanorana parkeri]|uniref:apoptosis-associated speck-like protein containing a CARD n=1 Tax=Nanorana parkeri TaxID=125878 RepID=UPI0008542C2F|nr:PREDICTED: apoptosis-associated speck-like protein containing a CARD [Nanorana parkeri]